MRKEGCFFELTEELRRKGTSYSAPVKWKGIVNLAQGKTMPWKVGDIHENMNQNIVFHCRDF
jgi:hypothetical protein